MERHRRITSRGTAGAGESTSCMSFREETSAICGWQRQAGSCASRDFRRRGRSPAQGATRCSGGTARRCGGALEAVEATEEEHDGEAEHLEAEGVGAVATVYDGGPRLPGLP
jgi:hypothetical protein